MKTIKHTNTLVYYDGVQVFAGQDDVGAMIDTVGDANRRSDRSNMIIGLERRYYG